MYAVTFYWTYLDNSRPGENGNPAFFGSADSAWEYLQRGMRNNHVRAPRLERAKGGRIIAEGEHGQTHVCAVLRRVAA